MGPGDLASMGAGAWLRRVFALPRRLLRLGASAAWRANAAIELPAPRVGAGGGPGRAIRTALSRSATHRGHAGRSGGRDDQGTHGPARALVAAGGAHLPARDRRTG